MLELYLDQMVIKKI